MSNVEAKRSTFHEMIDYLKHRSAIYGPMCLVPCVQDAPQKGWTTIVVFLYIKPAFETVRTDSFNEALILFGQNGQALK